MNKHQLARWLVFFPARIFDLLVILIMAVLMPYFWFKIRKKHGEYLKLSPKGRLKDIAIKGFKDPVDDFGFVRPESHTLLQQAGNGLLNPDRQQKLLEQVIYPNDTLYRQFPNDEHHLGPSGDGISSWVFAYNLWGAKRPDLVKRLAVHYLKNCFGIWWNSGNGVSARSSNGGVSIVVDGWPKGKSWWKYNWGIMQPTTGPGYFTGAALFALAAKELGGIWKLVYAFHYTMLGGWFWELAPVMYTKTETWYYTHHITAINLWSLHKTRGGYKWALKWIADLVSPSGNAQPTICALAWNAGAINNSKHNQAVSTLLTVQGAHYWPQHAPLDPYFFEVEKDNTDHYSMAALAALLLMAPAGTEPEDLFSFL
jgi:hypothetical protein